MTLPATILIASAAILASALALCLALAFAPRRNMETQIGIAAAPEKVWAVLSDTRSYHEWNPFIHAIVGDLAEGSRLTNTLTPLDGGSMVFHPMVLAAEPGRELRWLGRLFMPRLFDGEHYFRLAPHDGGTCLVHGENFRGILLWVIGIERFRKSFEAMNAALKARVEAKAPAPSRASATCDTGLTRPARSPRPASAPGILHPAPAPEVRSVPAARP